ncbi:uncharacterized protein LOC114286297 [Camellia sinensis]|uniref:uncharacterized protein LOC114286297 n=1 Tax=Camellia sinensis TaxID=4442 RepID=UPI001036B563|nr:uncharacterized protein LOC114286297 [Camellia sinensis]
MFAFFCQQSRLRHCGSVGISATTHLGFLPKLQITIPIKFFSSKKTSTPPTTKNEIECFTVSHLVNSCGLSPEIANSISHKVHFRTSDGPDSVLSFFRDRLSRTEVADLVASAPFLLRYSLKNRLILALDFIKSVVLLDKRGVFALMLRPRFFWIHVDKNAIPNVALLGELGVPQSCISLLVSGNPSVVAGNKDKFNLCARKAIEMGFDPSKVTFVDAICVFFGMSTAVWERKVEVYKRWGLSDDDTHWAFKKFPRCMILSEKKITSGMDFLVNEIGFEPITVVRTPKTLGYSLEKRIIPRCSVIRDLSLNGLIKKEKGLSAILSTSEERFLDAFVTKYQDQVPQLLNVYQKKTDVLELGIGNEGTP